MEQVMREFEIWKKNKYLISREDKIAAQTGSKLSKKMADYCEKGPFILHQPQCVATGIFVMKHFQNTLPAIG